MKRFNLRMHPIIVVPAPLLLCFSLLVACRGEPFVAAQGGGDHGSTSSTVTSSSTGAGATANGQGGHGGTGGQGGEGGGASDPCPEQNNPFDDAGPTIHLFVDPVFGNDACPGTKNAPVHTVTRALSIAISGQIVHLPAGTYTYDAKRGEDFSAPVQDGVSIMADQNGDAVLVGQGASAGLAFLGDGAATHLTIQGFVEGIRAKTGAQNLEAVNLVGNACGARLEGDASATFTDVNVSEGTVGVELLHGASLQMNGGVFKNIGKECVLGAKVVGVSNAASLTLDGVSLRDSFGALAVHNAATATIRNSTFERIGQSGCGAGTSVELGEASSLLLKDTSFSEGHGSAVSAFSAGVVVDITGGVIQTEGAHGLSLGVATAAIRGTTLVGNNTSYGIHLDFGTLSLDKVFIHHFLTGVHQAGGVATLRDTSVTNCTYGVLFLAGSLDLGKVGDPGGNALQGNDDTALYIGASEPVTIAALGNGWTPLLQGVSALGVLLNHGTILGPFGENAPKPRNFVLIHPESKVTY